MYKKNKTEQTLTMYHCLKFSDNWSVKWISHSLFSLEDPILSSGSKEVYINNAGSAYFGQGENPEKVRVTELNNNYWRHGWNIGIFKCWFTWYHLKIRAKILFIEYYFCNHKRSWFAQIVSYLNFTKSYKLYTYKYTNKEIFTICWICRIYISRKYSKNYSCKFNFPVQCYTLFFVFTFRSGKPGIFN